MKIRAFVREIFAKQFWCFLFIDFQCIFYISAIMHPRSLPRWIFTEWLWNCFEIRPQNLPISGKWKHQFQLIFCILRLSHKHTDFVSSRGTPYDCLFHFYKRNCCDVMTYDIMTYNVMTFDVICQKLNRSKYQKVKRQKDQKVQT